MEGGLFPYAKLYFRITAMLIDYAIVTSFGLTIIVSLNFWFSLFFGGSDFFSSNIKNIFFAITTILYFFYSLVFESSKFQATPGKLAMGIQISAYEGNELNSKAVVFRSLLKSCFFLLLLVPQVWFFVLIASIFMALLNKRRQLPHDVLSGTIVLKVKPAVLSK